MEKATFTQIQENEQEFISGGYNAGEVWGGIALMAIGVAGEAFVPELTPVNVDFLTAGFGTACKGLSD